jgi:hypothetical protein
LVPGLISHVEFMHELRAVLLSLPASAHSINEVRDYQTGLQALHHSNSVSMMFVPSWSTSDHGRVVDAGRDFHQYMERVIRSSDTGLCFREEVAMNAFARVTTVLVFASASVPYGALGQGQVDAVQFQRLLHPADSMRLYTFNQAEISRITANGEWQREGTEGWLFPSPVVGTTPLYRLYLNKDGKHPDHLYTANRDEGNQVIKTWDFAYEGIAGYVASTPSTGATPDDQAPTQSSS